MLVNENSLFGEDLFGLGQVAASGYPVVVQARSPEDGSGVRGATIQILASTGKIVDEQVTQGTGYAALLAPTTKDVKVPYQVYLAKVPPGFVLPEKRIIATGESPIRVGWNQADYRTTDDRQYLIDSTIGKSLRGPVTNLQVHISRVNVEDTERRAAEAEAREAAAKAAEEEALRKAQFEYSTQQRILDELEAAAQAKMDQIRYLQEEQASAEMLKKAEDEARQAELAAQAQAQKLALAKAAAAAAAAAAGETNLLPYIIGGVALAGLGVGLYFFFSKRSP